MDLVSKPVKPKQIAGRGVTRTGGLPPGAKPVMQQKPNKTSYGVIIKIIWKDKLLDPRIETLKLLKETEWSVDAIDCDGNLHDRLSKTDFIFLGYADEMAIICEPEVEYGVLWRVVDKKDLMHGQEEIIRIIEVPDIGSGLTYINSEGKKIRERFRIDLLFLGIVPEDDAPEAISLKTLKGREKEDGEEDDDSDDAARRFAWGI